MNNAFWDNSTEQMQAVITVASNTCRIEAQTALERAQAAHNAANITLPATAFSGKPVVVGARNNMLHLRNYYLTIARAQLELVRRFHPSDFRQLTNDYADLLNNF